MSAKYLNKIVLVSFLIIGCGSSLRIRDFPTEKTADKNPFLTSQASYSRNMISGQEIVPPITEDWEENYSSLPNNGFTTVDNWLLFGMLNGYLAAIDVDDGDLEGKKNLGDACAVPPTIYKSILYQSFETGSKGLIAYDVADGRSSWSIEGHLSRSSPIVANDMVYFQSLNGFVAGLQYETGEEQWQILLNRSIRNSPAFKDDMLIVATLEGTVFALESLSGEVLWEVELGIPVFSDPVIEEDRIYIATHSGRLVILDLNNGGILSHKDFEIELFNSPTVDQDNIYITSSNGILYTVDKQTLSIHWTFSGEGPVVGSALVTNSYVYLTTLARKLYIIDKNNGDQLQKIELTGRARSAPIISQGKLILACEENRVIAYVENR